MKDAVLSNKSYLKCNISESPNIFRGYYNHYEISEDILKRLAKDLGFSYDTYLTLYDLDEGTAENLVKSMSLKSKHPEILFLVDESKVVNYTLESERSPILNSEFITRILSLVDTSDSIEVSEIYYHKDDTISFVIIKKTTPITIEETYLGKDSKLIKYDIGVLLVNDEVSNAYSRLVLYVENQPLYLPASYYNTTTSRYRRSTSSSIEALEVLALKIIDDLREDVLHSKIYDLHFIYRANKYILASYEEYNNVLRTMRKIPTVIEDNSYIENLTSQYDEFEKKYVRIEDKKSSYIWRCTALSDITVGGLISITSSILNEISAPPVEYSAIRELLGTYVSTNRIAEEIAKEEIQ